MRRASIFLIIATLFISLVSCGGGDKVKVSEVGEKLMAKSWKLQVQEVLDDATSDIKDETGISADIKLEGDVAKIADFLAETLTFGKDTNDPSKLAYEKKYGEGILSTSVIGWWEMSADDKYVIFKEWDSATGAEKTPVKYEIKELTADKLVLLREGDTNPNIYVAK
jgi:hypothetical protein